MFPEIAKLRDDVGLIEQKSVGNTTVYRKTKIDKVLGLTKELERQYSVESMKPQEKSNDKEQAANGDNGTI
jgi:hypothetical protein